MQAARTNVFGACVYLAGDFRNPCNTIGGKIQGDVFRGDQRAVLLRQRGIGFRQNALEFCCAECFQFNTDGQAPLQFGDQVRGF